MEASSQIQNLLCLLLLHLCNSFFHYLTLDQVGPRSEPQTETEGTGSVKEFSQNGLQALA